VGKVVEESLYLLIASIISASLLVIVAFLLPFDDIKKVIKAIMEDIEYMVGYVKGL